MVWKMYLLSLMAVLGIYGIAINFRIHAGVTIQKWQHLSKHSETGKAIGLGKVLGYRIP